MAKDKKGFILYADQKELFDQLPNDKAGELIKHIFSYVNDENPITEDLLINLAFTPIKQQLKRDLKKFEEVKIKRSEAGKKSAEARRNKAQQSSTKSTSVKSVEQSSTKSTVTVNDNDNVTVNDKVKDINKGSKNTRTSFEEKKTKFLKWFNQMLKKHKGKEGRFRSLSKDAENNYKKLIDAKHTIEEFEHAFKVMLKEPWVIKHENANPSHFLRNDNFNRYLSKEYSDKPKINMI